MAGLGDTFILPKPGQDTEHLWVLITQADPVTGEGIMVNITTQRPHSDTTTILGAGEHPFIRKPSVVFYADARMVGTELLDRAIQSGSYRANAPFAASVLARIQAGIALSPMTPRKIKAAFAAATAAGLA
ncbi:MAG: hypothetical protein WCH98_03980 [Verrucomicrobiota bacterium]